MDCTDNVKIEQSIDELLVNSYADFGEIVIVATNQESGSLNVKPKLLLSSNNKDQHQNYTEEKTSCKVPSDVNFNSVIVDQWLLKHQVCCRVLASLLLN